MGVAVVSVIKVGVAYMNVSVLRCLKEELTWAIDKWLQVINYIICYLKRLCH